eukprot:239839-Chlamydomonas_euryale.AAC.1
MRRRQISGRCCSSSARGSRHSARTTGRPAAAARTPCTPSRAPRIGPCGASRRRRGRGGTCMRREQPPWQAHASMGVWKGTQPAHVTCAVISACAHNLMLVSRLESRLHTIPQRSCPPRFVPNSNLKPSHTCFVAAPLWRHQLNLALAVLDGSTHTMFQGCIH